MNQNILKYEKYKNSSVHWLGEIPEHWEVKRLKDVLNFGTGLSITKKNLTKIGIFCVNYGEIHSKYGFEVNPKIHTLKYVDEKYLSTSKKSLLKKEILFLQILQKILKVLVILHT